MRISDWSSDVCSSDLRGLAHVAVHRAQVGDGLPGRDSRQDFAYARVPGGRIAVTTQREAQRFKVTEDGHGWLGDLGQRHIKHRLFRPPRPRSEERRVGTEGVSQCRMRWQPDSGKTKINYTP